MSSKILTGRTYKPIAWSRLSLKMYYKRYICHCIGDHGACNSAEISECIIEIKHGT